MVMISLMSLVDSWAAFYQDSTPTQVTVQFLHTGGLLAAGGMALASDRNMLRVPVGDRSALIAMREAQEGIHVWSEALVDIEDEGKLLIGIRRFIRVLHFTTQLPIEHVAHDGGY